MIPYSNKNYSLSPTVIFVMVGFILLLSIIFFHGYINQPSRISWPWLVVGTSQAASNPVPETILGEIINAKENISAYPEYLKDASYSMKKLYELNHPRLFITQE